jgi:hypothetical protein
VTNPNPLTTDIEFYIAAAYPFLPGPSIIYDVTFEFKANASRTQFTASISGWHTAFPDAEGYIDNGQPYTYAASSWFGPRPWNLGALSPKVHFTTGPVTIA